MIFGNKTKQKNKKLEGGRSLAQRLLLYNKWAFHIQTITSQVLKQH